MVADFGYTLGAVQGACDPKTSNWRLDPPEWHFFSTKIESIHYSCSLSFCCQVTYPVPLVTCEKLTPLQKYLHATVSLVSRHFAQISSQMGLLEQISLKLQLDTAQNTGNLLFTNAAVDSHHSCIMPLPWSSKGVGRSQRDKTSWCMVLKCLWCFTGEYEREAYRQQNNYSNHSHPPKGEKAEVKLHVGVKMW